MNKEISLDSKSGTQSEIKIWENLPERRSRFFSGVRNKFMAMALAGFVTLGAGWERSFADQLKLVKGETGAHHFILESAIAPEKVKAFEAKLKEEEPEFISWALDYSQKAVANMDSFTNQALNFKEIAEGSASSQINENLDILKNLKKGRRRFEDCQRFLKDNLFNIIIGVALLEDSKTVRDNMTKLTDPPSFVLVPHDLPGRRDYGVFMQGEIDLDENSHDFGKRKSRINFTPAVYGGGLDFNIYINVFVHELIHALNSDPKISDTELKGRSNLRQVLEEGITQNLTLEIVQQLKSQRKSLKPSVAIINYDDRVILAAILEGISRSKQGNDSLSRWHAGIIDDNILVNELRPIVMGLGLNEKIATDLREVGSNPDLGDPDIIFPFKEKMTYKLLTNLLARLRISDVALSPDFIKSILMRGRSLDDFQVESLDEEFGSLPTDISKRQEEIKEIRP